MKVISTRAHGMLDYLVGLLLIAAPWVFNFADNSAAMWVPIIIGVMTIVMSLITDYELSIAKIIPLRVHLVMDALSGLVLAASPWLFNFDEIVYLPHLVVGLMEIVVVVLTDRSPATTRRHVITGADARTAH